MNDSSQKSVTAYCSQTLVFVEGVPTKTHDHGEHIEMIDAESCLWCDYLRIAIVDACCSN